MSVEASYVIISDPKIAPEALKTKNVPPGSCENIDFMGIGAKISVFCDVNNKKGSVMINDPEESISVFKIENLEDGLTTRIDKEPCVEIREGQKVVIIERTNLPMKTVVFFLNSNDKKRQNASQNEQLEPRLFAS
jgi:hypothetical protein